MCNRTEIVTNGCSGNCCERFGLPYSMEEFQEMKKQVLADQYTFTDRKGNEKTIPLRHEMEYIVDMLIPVDYSNISAESDFDGQTIIERFEAFKKLYNEPDRVVVDGDMNGCDLKEDGQLWGHYFTCKHFDKVNRICSAYESRPYFCRSFGVNHKCGYRGCGINDVMEKLREAEKEAELKQLSELQQMPKLTPEDCAITGDEARCV